jgi:hypothetical protein
LGTGHSEGCGATLHLQFSTDKIQWNVLYYLAILKSPEAARRRLPGRLVCGHNDSNDSTGLDCIARVTVDDQAIALIEGF